MQVPGSVVLPDIGITDTCPTSFIYAVFNVVFFLLYFYFKIAVVIIVSVPRMLLFCRLFLVIEDQINSMTSQ